MYLLNKRFLVSAALAVLTVSTGFAKNKAKKDKSAEYAAKITASLAEVKVEAKVQKERKLLVYSKASGYYHQSIPTASKMLELMADKTQAFKVVFNDDAKFFTKENLAQFDAVVFNNTTHSQKAFNDEQKKAFLDYIREGGAFVGIHAASDCGTSTGKNVPVWAEVTEMIGGAFNGHPWTAGGTWGMRVEDKDGGITKFLGGKGFMIKDEIYKYKDYNRENLRVLVSIDMEKSYHKKGRADNDHAVVWIKKYGKGRVYMNSLGHNHSTFWNPTALQLFLNGIQWATGDLEADSSSLALPKEHAEFEAKKKK